jgi:hypothetical protein
MGNISPTNNITVGGDLVKSMILTGQKNMEHKTRNRSINDDDVIIQASEIGNTF